MRALDPESSASANSATLAISPRFLSEMMGIVNVILGLRPSPGRATNDFLSEISAEFENEKGGLVGRLGEDQGYQEKNLHRHGLGQAEACDRIEAVLITRFRELIP